ncbi:MAG: penicillin-binding protein 1C [Anaerolineae bacterium]
MLKVRTMKRFIFEIAGLLLFLGVLCWGTYAWLFIDLPSPEEIYSRTASLSTKIYDRNGLLLYEIIDPNGGKHTPLPLEEIPLYLRQATIATEDASFYTNPGLDLKGVLRAVLTNLFGVKPRSGGSTITQQVARNILLPPEEGRQRTLTRKLREMILAWRLAKTYSKDEILALYLNETYYGNLAYGVEAAAQIYFGKHASELDLAECAILAGLPQAPARYNPLTDPEEARKRQALVLDLMVRHGYISREEAELAKREKLNFAAAPFPIRAPHFVMHVRRLLEDEFGLERLQQGGLRVYTTLDVHMQEIALAIVRRHLKLLRECGRTRPCPYGEIPSPNVNNAALVALDVHTGEVLAMLGSPDYFDPRIDGAVNAALAPRQPGSAIKPFTYAAAFERDYTPATMIVDTRTSFVTKEGDPYVPMNYDRRFHGPVLLRTALGSSFNLVAVKVLDHVGVENMIDLARLLGIKTFNDRERFGLALTLGGGEVRLLELTAAYAAFANEGRRVEPVCIARVEDSQGKILWENRPQPGPQVLSPQVAYLITDILADDWARIPGFGEGSVLKLSRPAAVKTGTTTDWRDNWTVGYTPDLAVGVWVGNADNSPMLHVSGITGAAPIWHDFMEEVLKARPAKQFVEPPGLVRVEICSESGLLPNPDCPHRRVEIFIAGTEPKKVCSMHRAFLVDKETGLLAGPGCPPENLERRVYTILPAEAKEWGRKMGIPEPPAELCYLHGERAGEDASPLVAEAFSFGESEHHPIVITSPDPGSIFQISPAIPRRDQQIEVAARPGEGVILTRVIFYVDGERLGTASQPPYRLMWPLEPGEHTFHAVGYDREGRRLESRTVRIAVRGN